jgi:hypothetical protein
MLLVIQVLGDFVDKLNHFFPVVACEQGLFTNPTIFDISLSYLVRVVKKDAKLFPAVSYRLSLICFPRHSFLLLLLFVERRVLVRCGVMLGFSHRLERQELGSPASMTDEKLSTWSPCLHPRRLCEFEFLSFLFSLSVSLFLSRLVFQLISRDRHLSTTLNFFFFFLPLTRCVGGRGDKLAAFQKLMIGNKKGTVSGTWSQLML